MGEDARPRLLDESVGFSDLSDLIAGLYLVVDHSTFADSEKMLLKEMLWTAIITDALSTVDYAAITPKAFLLSVATDARKGIVQLAKAAEVAAREAGTVLTCDKIDALETEIFTPTGSIDVADISAGLSNVACTASTVTIAITGNVCTIFGELTLQNVLNHTVIQIIINNIGRPVKRQSLNGCIAQVGAGVPLKALAITIEPYSTASAKMLISLADSNSIIFPIGSYDFTIGGSWLRD
jgi:hypothetical protein